MSQMFYGATKFNQPIGGWKLKQSVNMSYVLNNTAISCQNLSATLVAWKAQADTNANLKNVNLGSFINNYQYYNENGRAAVDSLKKAPCSWSISRMGKRTLVTRLGDSGTRVFFVALLVAGAICFALSVAYSRLSAHLSSTSEKPEDSD